jgi:MalT-like TPR region
MAQDDLAEAQSSFEQSLQLRKELGEKGGIADCQLSLAALALERKQAEQAASLAGQAAQEFDAENDPDRRTAAQDLLAQARLAQGQISDARHAVSIAEQLQSHDQLTTMSFQITAARLLGKTGQRSQAQRQLRQLESEATQKGLIAIAWQARLALAETEIQSGQFSVGRSHLQSVQREAAHKGYRLFARKASELQNSLMSGTAKTA